MDRREFLKLGVVAALPLILPKNLTNSLAAAQTEIHVKGVWYRGTPDGNVFVSHDQGRTWQLHTSFGEEYAVQSIQADRQGRISLKLEYKGREFTLSLASDQQRWRTVA